MSDVVGGQYLKDLLAQQQGGEVAQPPAVGMGGLVTNTVPPAPKAVIAEAQDQRPFLVKLLSSPVDLAAGIAEGVLEDPLLNFLSPTHWAYNAAAWATGLPNTRALAAQIDEATKGRTLASIGEVVGQLAPSFALGAGLYSLGRAAAVKALSLGVASGRAARVAGVLGSEFVQSSKIIDQLGVVAARTSGASVAPPLVERLVGEAGGAIGVGLASGLESGVRAGADQNSKAADVAREAAEGFLFGTAITAGAGLALGGAAKLIGQSREIPSAVMEARLAARPEYQKLLKDASDEGVAALKELRNGVLKRRDTVAQLEELKGTLGRPAEPYAGHVELFDQHVRLPAIEEKLQTARVGLSEAREGYRAQIGSNKAVYELLNPKNPIPSQYTRLEPYNPDTKNLFLAQMYTKLLQTPEGLMRKSGVSGVRFLQSITAAEHERVVGSSVISKMVGDLRKDAIEILKPSLADTRGGRSAFLTPLVDAYEKSGIEGVRAYFGKDADTATKMVNWFSRVEDLKKDYSKVVKLGAKDYMTPAEMEAMGVKAFWPHVQARATDSALMQRQLEALMRPVKDASGKVTRQGMTREQAEMFITRNMLSTSQAKQGVRQFGNQDFRRENPGTLLEKLQQGQLLEADPLLGLERYLSDVNLSHAYGKRFGYGNDARKQVTDVMLRMVQAEGGSVPLMKSVMDELLFVKFYPAAWNYTAQMLTSLQTASKLPFAVLSNMGGVAQVPLFAGLNNTVKGLHTLVKDPATTEYIRHAIGAHESLFASLRRSYIGQSLQDSVIDRFADSVLKYTGFNAVEKFNRLLSGAAVYQSIMDDAAKGVAGRYRGATLDTVRRRWSFMGLDYNTAIPQLKRALDGGVDLKTALNQTLGGKFDEAIFNAARATQGIPIATTRPTAWSHPAGRVMTQFKSFSLNQGRLLMERVVGEYAKGNPEPLAYLASLYPVAGDFIRNSQILAKGKDRKETGVDRYLDDLAAVGGFGLTHQFLQSLKYGDLDTFVLGPTYGDVERGLGALYQLTFNGKADRAKRELNRTPLYQLMNRLYEGGTGLFKADVEKYAALDSASAPPEIEPFGNLFQQRTPQ